MDDYDDFDDDRCMTCDARYCGSVCNSNTPGYVYASGHGWVRQARAEELLATNRTFRVWANTRMVSAS